MSRRMTLVQRVRQSIEATYVALGKLATRHRDITNPDDPDWREAHDMIAQAREEAKLLPEAEDKVKEVICRTTHLVDLDDNDRPRTVTIGVKGKAARQADQPDPTEGNAWSVIWGNGAWGFYSTAELEEDAIIVLTPEVPQHCPFCGSEDITFAVAWKARSMDDSSNTTTLDEWLCRDCDNRSFWS